MSWFSGKKGKFSQISTLGEEQQPLYGQLQAANMGTGAGGSFGGASDYYHGLMGDNSSDYQAFAAPQMRQFNEQTIPGLAEQFAGMGSGGLSSSGFRNAAVSAGADLSERLGSIRAQLRQQGAQGLMSLGQQGLQNYNENIYQPPTQGAAAAIGPLFGQIAGAAADAYVGAPPGTSKQLMSAGSKAFGSSDPYGGQGMGGMG